MDALPEISRNNEHPKISFEINELIEAVNKLNYGSAPGSSGWSFRSLGAILAVNEEVDDTSHLQTVLEFSTAQ